MDDLTHALVGLPTAQIEQIHYEALMKFDDLCDSAPGSLEHAWAGIWGTLVHSTDSAKNLKAHAIS
jgi:hypothetical protein